MSPMSPWQVVDSAAAPIATAGEGAAASGTAVADALAAVEAEAADAVARATDDAHGAAPFASERRAFVMVLIRQTTVLTASYNLPLMLAPKVHAAVSNLVKWANCRANALHRMLHTKLGLHHHVPMPKTAPHVGGSVELRCDSMAELKLVIECESTPTAVQLSEVRSAVAENVDVIGLIEGTFPEVTMHDSFYGKEVQPIRRHGP
jgi:hypothetical protein